MSICANSSLPTPDSPTNSTVARVGATRRSIWQAALKAEDTPTMGRSPAEARPSRGSGSAATSAPGACTPAKPSALR